MAQSLKKQADSASFKNAEVLSNQYEKLRTQIITIYPKADNFLPTTQKKHVGAHTINLEELLGETRINIGQMLTYLTAKSIPDAVNLFSQFKEAGLIRFDDPFQKLSPILKEYGLTANWAITTTALCLIEIMVNRKLIQLKDNTSGEFRKRVSRLRKLIREIKKEDIPELLISALYEVRNKVIHEGKKPTPEETRKIFEILLEFHNKIRF